MYVKLCVTSQGFSYTLKYKKNNINKVICYFISHVQVLSCPPFSKIVSCVHIVPYPYPCIIAPTVGNVLANFVIEVNFVQPPIFGIICTQFPNNLICQIISQAVTLTRGGKSRGTSEKSYQQNSYHFHQLALFWLFLSFTILFLRNNC